MIIVKTIKELYTTIVSSIGTYMQVQVNDKDKTYINAVASTDAAILKSILLTAQKVQQNIFPDTAEQESGGGTLERFGRAYLGRNPNEPTSGTYQVTVTGSVGAVIKAGQTFKSDIDTRSPNKLYILDDDYTFTSLSGTIDVRALEAGSGSSLNVGDTLRLTNPIANVSYIATVITEEITPIDEESIEDYRAKILLAMNTVANGGCATDYRVWGMEVVGVANIYPFSQSGDNASILVFVEADGGDGSASNIMTTNVYNALYEDPDTTKPLYKKTRVPMGVNDITVLSVTPVNVNIEIGGLNTLSNVVKNTIQSAIEAKVIKVRPFVDAIDADVIKNNTISKDMIRAIIYTTYPSANITSILLEVDGNSVESFVFDLLGLELNIPLFPSVAYV